MKRGYWTEPMTFVGDHGVEVSARAFILRPLLSPDFRVQEIAFEGGTFNVGDEQREAAERIKKYIRSFVGEPLGAWDSASFVSAEATALIKAFRTPRIPAKKHSSGGFTGTGDPSMAAKPDLPGERRVVNNATIDLTGCTTREQAEALVMDYLRRPPVLAEAWDGTERYDGRHLEAEHRTPSNTLNRVIKEFRKREEFGLGKYGTTVDRTDLSRKQWLQHAKEEAMDSVLYLDRLIQIEDEIELKKSVKLTVDDRASEEFRKGFETQPFGVDFETQPFGVDFAEWLRRNPCKPPLQEPDHNTTTNLSDFYSVAFVASTDPVVRVPQPPFPGPGTPVADSFFHTRLFA